MRRSLISMMMSTSLLLAFGASAFNKPPFPRLATNWIANQNYEQADTQKQLARGTIALITVWPGWESGRGTTVDQVIRNIKAINPNTMVFDYLNNSEIGANRAAFTNYADLYAKLDAMNWYAYASGSCCTALSSLWPGYLTIDSTLLTSADSNGDHWPDWFAKWAISKYYVPNPSLDGFYLDNTTWKPLVDADWNRDGMIDSAGGWNGSTTVYTPAQTWYRQGLRQHFEVMHQNMPGKYQLGNVANWGDPSSVLTEFQGELNGGFMEALIGNSWSVETWGGWQGMMAWYRRTMNALAEPKLGMFHQIGSTTDYQGFRYGFTSCLMDDGYYTFNSGANDSSGYGDAPWFDEYQSALGTATSSPPTDAWQKGVYRRDFANGIALVNPKGNGAQTITLEGDFKRISGTQAPAVNNGQTVRTLTLQDRDGIILMRLQPLTTTTTTKTPAPPSSLKVQ